MEKDNLVQVLTDTEDLLQRSRTIDEVSRLEQVREEIVLLSGSAKRRLQAAAAEFKRNNDTENAQRADSLLSAIFDESARLVTLGARLMLSPREEKGEPLSSTRHDNHHHHRHSHHSHTHKVSTPREHPTEKAEDTDDTVRNRSASSGKARPAKPGLGLKGEEDVAPRSRSSQHKGTPSKLCSRGGRVSPLVLAATGEERAQEREGSGGPPDIPAAQIEICEEIGSGSYGTVYRGKVGGKWAAVKVPKRQSLSAEQMGDFVSEIRILKQITCQHVVQFFGACTEPGKLMIVTELMVCDLDSVIHKKTKFVRLGLAKKLCLAQDMAAGINWLHTICNIVHRDLKPANFLLDSAMHAKVTDFGFSKALRDGRETLLDASTAKGSLLYMAPEVMRHEEYGKPADVYGYGLILYELLTEEEPFNTFDDPQTFVHAIKEGGHRQEIPDDLSTPEGERVPQSLCALLRACTDPDQARRPPIGEVLARLDAATVEVVTGDAASPVYKFWMDNFVGPFQEEVPWQQVEAALSKMINVAPITLTKVKRLVVHKKGSCSTGGDPPKGKFLPALTGCDIEIAAGSSSSEGSLLKSPEIVSLEMLNNAFLWFGDFFNPDTAPKVLFEIGRVSAAQWFHGDITQKEAEMRLNQRNEGTFLIRASKTSPRQYPFTLSRLKGGMPTHKRIGRLSYNYEASERYTVQTTAGPFKCQTIAQVVDRLKELGDITEACPKSIFLNAYDN